MGVGSAGTGLKPDLAKVLEHYGADLPKTYGNMQILCVVHSENVTSCSVDLDQGVMYCHACGFGGDALSLIQVKEHCDYRAAVEWAEKNVGLTVGPPVNPGRAGISGTPGTGGGGYRARFRRRAGVDGQVRGSARDSVPRA